MAVREGRDDLAKQALGRQQEHAERAASLEQTWRSQASETEKLKASLRQLNEKIEEAKRKRNLLIAKQKRAQAQRRIHETMSGLSDTSAFEAFNRMADKIEDTERRSLAAAEVDEALTLPSVEKEFLQLEASSSAVGLDDRLGALKAQMGLLGGGEVAEAKQIGAGSGDGSVQDAEVEIEDETANDKQGGQAAAEGDVPEAQLIEEFERLEQRE